MSRPVILRGEALQDLREARDEYVRRQPGLGLKLMRRVFDALELIDRFPNIHGKIWKTVRATTVKRYPHVIYYRVHADHVEILAVLHGSQDIGIVKGRA